MPLTFYLPQLLEQAEALHQAGRIAEAESLYRQILVQNPTQPRARYLLGVTRLQQGQSREALDLIGPALKTDPDAADMLLHYGVALQMVGRLPEAMVHLDRSLARDPENPDGWSSRGLVLWQLGRSEEALQSYDQALARRPQDSAALYNSGCILQRLNRPRDALARFDKALALQPDFAGALNNRGLALADLGLYEAALDSYERALAAAPGHGDILFNRGAALYYLKRFEAALASYEAARAAAPNHPYALGGAFAAAINLCDWPKVEKLGAAAAQAIAGRKSVILPFIFIHYSADMALQLRCAENFLVDKIPRPPARLWQGEAYRHEKIRIAYVSADFREHAVGYLIAEMIERHDHARFEITGIALSDNDGGAMRAHFAGAFDHFHEVRGRSDTQAATLLREQEIDIAVDLMGHTQGSRPGIFAHRPAPVQVSYLGYPGSMGADFIDYTIADAVVAPFGEQEFFREKIVHLPDCYQVNSRHISALALPPPPSRREAGLPEEGFVFCCFNNSRKITAAIFDVWMRLLTEVPQSVLWLVEEQGGASNRLQAAAVARGVDPARLVFAPRRKLPEHLARHRLADLFLDTSPYNAHATASFSLQAGVPLVTCRGDSFAGRVATSLLHGVGLPELSVESFEAYEELALKLARDPVLLGALRATLERNRATQPLFDTARFTRNLEGAYTVMWQRSELGEPPQSFAVPSR